MTHHTKGDRDRERDHYRQTTKPTSSPHSSEDQLPQYFIVRPDVTKQTASGAVTTKGPMVPLIPADQLPPWLGIVGVPRELDMEQMKGLRNLGETSKDFGSYEVCFLREYGGSSQDSNVSIQDQRKRQYPDSLTEGQVRKAAPATVDIQHATSKIPSNNNTKVSRKSGQKHLNKHHKRHDTPSDSNSGAESSGGEHSSGRSSSSKASASSSTDTELTYHLRAKDGLKGSRHAPTISMEKTVTSRSIPTDLVVPLNPRIPSPPSPPPSGPSNPYPVLHRKGPVPAADHPASRLLKAFAPGGGYSPTQPAYGLSSVTAHRGKDLMPSAMTYREGNHRDGSEGTIFCRHWCHHNTCKFGDVCKYMHEMPRTREGLREVGLSDWPMWYKSQEVGRQAGFAMALALQGRGGMGGHQSCGEYFGGNSPNPLLMMMNGTSMGGHVGSRVMSEQEKTELRARIELQDMAEKRAKMARDKSTGKGKKGKDRMKDSVSQESPPRRDEARSSGTDEDFFPDQTLEDRLREAELEDLEQEIRLQRMKEKARSESKGKGKEKEVVVENLMDL
ncbi:hypothetical protein SCUP234_04582 [Seiridium cupressi]